MEIKTLTKGPEQIFGVFKNGEAVLLNGGTAVSVDYTTKADGISVILPTTAMLYTFAGCVKFGEVLGTSGQPNELGLVQLYGHHEGVYVAGSTVTPGAVMIPVNTKSHVTLGVTSVHADSTAALVSFQHNYGYVIAGTTASLIATSLFGGTAIAFIKAM